MLALGVALLGTTAIGAIAAHAFGWCELCLSSKFLVLPFFLTILTVGLVNRDMGRVILRGWLYGIIAVLLYDLSRIPFMMYGWGDFIPTIGDWILGESDAHPVWGYTWRYVGNGGGLGIAFVVLNNYFKNDYHKVLLGVCYGLFVWLCLDAVLLFAPDAQNLMFEMNGLNVTGSLIGHIVYGGVLGYLVHRYMDQTTPVPRAGIPSAFQ